METLIIALLGAVVIAAVAVPLFLGGRSAHHDAREYATDPSATTLPAPAPVDAGAPAPATSPSGDALESEVARYREAVAAGTVCRRCGEANPRDAKFCADCGKPLASSDAQEFA